MHSILLDTTHKKFYNVYIFCRHTIIYTESSYLGRDGPHNIWRDQSVEYCSFLKDILNSMNLTWPTINLSIMWCILSTRTIHLLIIHVHVYVSNKYSIWTPGNNIIIYKYNSINSLNSKLKSYPYIIWATKTKCWIKLKLSN